VPVVDVVEIGNGGGSIAWVDDFGKLHVGPQSAGAVPGPAAYGRGGDEPTSTDACLALRWINPEYFCGGEIRADMPAVERALGALADRLGTTVPEAAAGVVRIANNNMVNALKLVSLNRGHDPRDFTLVAFGGGGGLHAVPLAAELGIRKVVVPRAADVFSAWGMLLTDLRRDYFVTRPLGLVPDNAGRLQQLLDEIVATATEQFAREGVEPGRMRFHRFGSFRYENQEHAVEVALPDGRLDAAAVAAMVDRFHTAYEREYTYRLDVPVEFVGAHVVATADVEKLEPVPLATSGRRLDEARKARRAVDYATEGVHEADVYVGELLEPGMRLDGPAIVESRGTTVVVHPGDELAVDDYGNVVIGVAGADENAGAP
jgi:N-methylhydantoinase A